MQFYKTINPNSLPAKHTRASIKTKLNARETENPAIQFMEHDNSCLRV